MASTAAALLPQQQQQGEVEEASNSEAVSSRSASSSGSVGSFFAVMSVLLVLAIISCVLGRIFSRRRGRAMDSPLDGIIKYGGCLGWINRRFRCCMAGEVEAGAKVMASIENSDANKAIDPPDV